MGAPEITDAARAVAGERARCLDAVDAAWSRMIANARAEGRRKRGGKGARHGER